MQSNLARSELVNLILQRKKEIETAGAIHKHDLTKNLHRLQKQLHIYDKLRKEAGMDA